MPRGQGGGPKTREGKARSSRNAVKHGFRVSPDRPHPYIIEGLEDPAEWEAFRQGIIDSWDAIGTHEEELATNIAHGHWKLRRCQVYESRLLSKQVAEVEEDLQSADAYDDDFADDDDEDDEDDGDEDHVVGATQGGAPIAGAHRESDAPQHGGAPHAAARSAAAIDPERLIRNQELALLPGGWYIDRMLRFEAFVRKALASDMRELEIQQARRNGIKQPLARVVFSSDPSPAKIHKTVNDMPEFQIARQNVRMAEVQLAERKLAARTERPGRA